MQSTDVDALRQSLEETYQQNRALIAGLSDADLTRPTPNPKWRVRQLAAHIAEDDAGALYVAKLLARGKNAKAPDFVVNLLNWWGLRKYKRATVPELVTVMDERHRALAEWLQAVPPDDWQHGGFVSQVGQVTLAEFLLQNRSHSQDHGDDIRVALGQPRHAHHAGYTRPAASGRTDSER